MSDKPTFRQGDQVRIDYEGRTVSGVVLFGSENSRSLVLSFEALVGGYVGNMPVLADETGAYADLMTGRPVGIQLIGRS